MTDRELERRLWAAARALDAVAPGFEPAVLGARRPRTRWALAIAACIAALAAVTAAPAAISSLGRFLGVTSVSELAPVEPDVAPPHLGRRVPRAEVERYVGFPVRVVPALGEPEKFYGRDDVAGGMVTAAYDGGRILLTQWPTVRVGAEVHVVASRGRADQVAVGTRAALWIAGEARGTFTVVGADGAVHRETFVVEDGALAWAEDGVGFLLHGAGSKAEAVRLAASVDRG